MTPKESRYDVDGSGTAEDAAPDWSLGGRVALVTGGSAGIGFAIARALGRAGAKVVVTSRRKEAVDEAAAALGGEAYGLACDVRDPTQVRDLIAGAVDRFDGLDILVNNAGGSFGDTFNRGPLTELTGEDFLEAYRLNVVSAFQCGKEALPYLRTAHLRTGDGGVIVNIGSVAGVHAGPRMAAYGAGKAALANLTRSMAEEWAPEVRVCGITVGHIDTPRVSANRTGDRLAKVLGSIALGRLGTAEDVAAAVTYLASPAGAWNTGAMLPLHGGEKEL